MTPEQIKAFRIEKNLTQVKLAQLLGVQQHTLNRWEKGHCKPSPMALRALMEFMGRA